MEGLFTHRNKNMFFLDFYVLYYFKSIYFKFQNQNQFSFANLISHSKPATIISNKKQRRKNKFQRQRKKNRTPYQEFLESRFQRLEREKHSNLNNVIQQTQTTSRRPRAKSNERWEVGRYKLYKSTKSDRLLILFNNSILFKIWFKLKHLIFITICY